MPPRPRPVASWEQLSAILGRTGAVPPEPSSNDSPTRTLPSRSARVIRPAPFSILPPLSAPPFGTEYSDVVVIRFVSDADIPVHFSSVEAFLASREAKKQKRIAFNQSATPRRRAATQSRTTPPPHEAAVIVGKKRVRTALTFDASSSAAAPSAQTSSPSSSQLVPSKPVAPPPIADEAALMSVRRQAEETRRAHRRNVILSSSPTKRRRNAPSSSSSDDDDDADGDKSDTDTAPIEGQDAAPAPRAAGRRLFVFERTRGTLQSRFRKRLAESSTNTSPASSPASSPRKGAKTPPSSPVKRYRRARREAHSSGSDDDDDDDDEDEDELPQEHDYEQAAADDEDVAPASDAAAAAVSEVSVVDGDEAASGGVATSAIARALAAAASESDYFQAQRTLRKSATSNHTLSKLPTLDEKELKVALQRFGDRFDGARAQLVDLYGQQFKQWLFELRCGFSLLMYGYGSKKSLLMRFANETLRGLPLVVVNGYSPALTLRSVLSMICSGALGHTGTFKSVQDQAAFIDAKTRDASRPRLAILVHNIDGAVLRSSAAQLLLSQLAACPGIFFIASIDHLNAPLLWDATMAARFNWLWHDLTTFEPYIAETAFEDSLLGDAANMTMRSLTYVVRSLPAAARRIFLILARSQLEAMQSEDASSDPWMNGLPVDTHIQMCTSEFLVINDQTYRAHLTELRDHKMVVFKKASDGVEYVYVPMTTDLVEQAIGITEAEIAH